MTDGGTRSSATTRPAFALLIAAFLMAVVAAGCRNVAEHRELTEPRLVRLDMDEVGRPRDFTIALTGGGSPPAWVIRADPEAPGGPAVLVQESADNTTYRFPLCIYDSVIARDVSVEMKFKAMAGSVDQTAGIVLRYRRENYYVARANALEDTIDLFKTVDGKRLMIAEFATKVTPNEWHALGFTAKGTHLIVTFDGKVAGEADDATFPGPGKIGLWTEADSISAFSDLRIAPAR